MDKRRVIKAVTLMRTIRDQIADEESGLTWDDRKKKLQRDLGVNPLWKRLKEKVRFAPSPRAKVGTH